MSAPNEHDAAAAPEPEPAAPPPPLPEVRQCQNPGDWQYGCTAVAGTKTMAGWWMVANPATGGHWADTDAVKDWAVLAAAPDAPPS